MLLIFLNRIEKMLKCKPRAADTKAGFAGPPEIDAAVKVDVSNLPGAVSACSGPELIDLLKIIRDNAEFLEIVYGDTLPIKNIIAAAEKAYEAVHLQNKSKWKKAKNE